MIHSGLVSITFRKLTAAQIIELVAQAGLEGIEWGGDVHVPHGDLRTAREVAVMTAQAGLNVAAYGSYYRVGHETDVGFDAIIATARELGAPTIRVWAGNQGSGEATDAYRDHVASETRRIADLAAAAGMTISYEFHSGTLTDTNTSALALLRAVDHPAARAYWQPPVGAEVEYCLQGLSAVLPWLSNVHVFHWQPAHDRRALDEGSQVWRRYLQVLASTGRDHYAMIEFVSEDAPVSFLDDAETLKGWLQSVNVHRPRD
jgi:sugar phosphate isomerase/epimerase